MALTQNEKFEKAIKNLKLNTEMIWAGSITTEEEFNKIKWVTGEDSNRIAITTKTNPHSELTWIKVNNKMIELQTAYDALDYQRKRKAKYPSIEECVHAILDDDLVVLQEKRTAVKLKYPKEGS